jgi:RHS repeat-associated protein
MRTRTNSTVNSQVNYTLDANGNLTSDGLRTFQYDGTNRLAKVILGSTFVGTDTIAGNELAAHTYLHNAAGQRVFKSEPKTELTTPDANTLGTGFVDWLRTNFSWLWATAQTNATLGNSYLYAEPTPGASQGSLPSWALLGEYGNGGVNSSGRTEYLWLPTQDGQAIPVGLYRAGKFHAIHTDHLGTPRLITNETNTPQWQWPYSAFGDNNPTGILRPTTSAGSAFTSLPPSGSVTTATLLATSTPAQVNNLRFPGQYADSETGLFYNYYRSYQASQGRYTQNDPIGLEGGWNRFGYVEGNPLSFSDPMGLWSVEASLHVGIGGSMTFGRDPSTGRGFLSGKFGVGLGTGFQYDPLGGRPGGGDGDKSKWGAGVGFYGEAGGALGPISGKLEGTIGRNFNYGKDSDLYRSFGPKGSLGKDGKWGIKGGASCGVEWSIF